MSSLNVLDINLLLDITIANIFVHSVGCFFILLIVFFTEEKGMIEDEMVGLHPGLNAHELEKTLGDGEGQGSLAYSSPWGRKELETTE